MTPKQQEILERVEVGRIDDAHDRNIDPNKLVEYLSSLESRLDDLYKILTPSQRIKLAEKDKELC